MHPCVPCPLHLVSFLGDNKCCSLAAELSTLKANFCASLICNRNKKDVWNIDLCYCSVRPTTKLVSDNTGAYLQLSELHYDMGELEDALRFVLFQNISVICPYHCDVFSLFYWHLVQHFWYEKGTTVVTVCGLANSRNWEHLLQLCYGYYSVRNKVLQGWASVNQICTNVLNNFIGVFLLNFSDYNAQLRS